MLPQYIVYINYTRNERQMNRNTIKFKDLEFSYNNEKN